MAKDYAKFVPRQPRPSKRPGGVAIILVIFLVIISLTAFSYVLYKKRNIFAGQASLSRAWFSRIAPTAYLSAKVVNHTKKANKVVMVQHDNQSHSQPPPIHFDFYNELPNMRVTLSELSKNSAITPSVKKSGNKSEKSSTPSGMPIAKFTYPQQDAFHSGVMTKLFAFREKIDDKGREDLVNG